MYPRFLLRAKASKITPSKFLQTNQIFIFGAKKKLNRVTFSISLIKVAFKPFLCFAGHPICCNLVDAIYAEINASLFIFDLWKPWHLLSFPSEINSIKYKNPSSTLYLEIYTTGGYLKMAQDKICRKQNVMQIKTLSINWMFRIDFFADFCEEENFQKEKRQKLPHCWSFNSFNGTVVNRKCLSLYKRLLNHVWSSLKNRVLFEVYIYVIV